MTERRFIPETPEALTADWLNTALNPASTITACERIELGDGEGFVGDILRLRAEHADGTRSSYIVKLPKLKNRGVGEMLGAYEREIMIYRTFGATLPVRTPRLYHADFDADRGSENQEAILRKADALPRWSNAAVATLGRWIATAKKRRYVLVIEDLESAQPGNQVEGIDRTRCAEVVAQIAALHAHFWQSEALKGHFWLLPMDVDQHMRHTVAVRARPSFELAFPESARRLAPFLDAVPTRGLAWNAALLAGPETLLHFDLRLDNLMFVSGEPVFIDWQLVRRGHPAYDLAYFLSGAVEDSDSAAPLLATYHDALCDQGVTGYSAAQLAEDYQVALRCVLMALSAVDQVDVGEGRGRALLAGWMRRLAQRLEADG